MKQQISAPVKMSKIQETDPLKNIPKTCKGSLSVIADPQQSLANSRLSIQPLSQCNHKNPKSNGKGLKLRDYMHLASIQKKSKSRSIHNITINNKSQFAIQPSMMASQPLPLNCSSSASIITGDKFNAAGGDCLSSLIKEDINAKIERQIQQLQDLKKFVQTNFQQNKNHDETSVFMYHFYNKIKDGCQRYDDLGKRIIQFEGKDKKEDKKEGSQTEISYWEINDRQLSSPAKILQRGLRLTYNAVQKLKYTTII